MDQLPEDVVKAFILWLDKHDLSICNYTSRSMIFWPVGDTERLVGRFVEETY